MKCPSRVLMRIMKYGTSLLVFILLVGIPLSTEAQSSRPTLEGMWSDPPATAVGDFCHGWCTDAGLDYLERLLDDPANDARGFRELQAEAAKHQQETYIVPRLTAAALETYPLDPADDPSFLRCEPYGLARQMRVRHQLEIRQRGNDLIEFHYGEWDARRTIYLNGRERPSNQTTLLGHSVAHWDGETLVVETAGIQANRLPFNAEHSDQLRVVERYARSKDDDTLVLTATMEDPWGLREPVVIKRIWRWAPESRIDPYEDCELPTEFTRGVTP